MPEVVFEGKALYGGIGKLSLHDVRVIRSDDRAPATQWVAQLGHKVGQAGEYWSSKSLHHSRASLRRVVWPVEPGREGALNALPEYCPQRMPTDPE